MANETDIGRLEGILQGLDSTIKKFDKALFGNGQPGAMERITRIEENIERLVEQNKKSGEEVTEQIKALASSVSDLKTIVNEHVKDNKSHSPFGLLVRKEVLLYLVAFFMFLHAIVPPDLSLWELVKQLLGL